MIKTHKILNAIQEGIKQSFMIDSELEDEDFVKSKISKSKDFVPYEYRFIDLGLSVKWAEYNLGACPGNSPNDWNGDYYAWGELKPKTKYTWDNYKFEESLTKYNKADNLTQLQPEDDVATQKLGNMYRMPTKAEFEELCNTTKVANAWVTNYKGVSGLNGRVFTSKVPGFEGNSIFIPAAGYFDSFGHYYAGSNGSVWSSSLYNNLFYNVYYFYFDSDNNTPYGNIRHRGFSVRSVQDKK